MQYSNKQQMQMLSVCAVAKLLNLSTSTIYRWINSQGLPVHQLPSGAGLRQIIRISLEDLNNWLEAYRVDLSDTEVEEPVLRLEGRIFTN